MHKFNLVLVRCGAASKDQAVSEKLPGKQLLDRGFGGERTELAPMRYSIVQLHRLLDPGSAGRR